MRSLLIVLFVNFFNTFSAQSLHHEMISAQGGGVVTASGVKVNYTVGQQSVIGTNSNQYIVQQGFQQNNWNKVVNQNKIDINTTVYPIPFKEVVNFSFSNSPGKEVSLYVFDFLGRLVCSKVIKNEDNLVSVNLSNLPSAEYIVKLSSDNYIFSTKILKQ